MRRAVGAVAAVLVIWSLQDIIVWGAFIEHAHRDHSPTLGAIYQQYHQMILVLLVVAVVVVVRGVWLRLWAAATAWTLAYSGACDILYYALALRPLPPTLPWLDGPGHILVLFHPATGTTLALSALVWASAWAVLLGLGSTWHYRVRGGHAEGSKAGGDEQQIRGARDGLEVPEVEAPDSAG